jgi:hypothetical protein
MSRIFRWIWILIVAVSCHCLAAGEKAIVRLYAVDQFGRGLGSITVIKFTDSTPGSVDYSSRFKDGEAQEIPLGEYKASIRVGNIPISGSVSVQAADVFAVLTASGQLNGNFYIIPEYGPGAWPLLKGKVSGLARNANGPIWIKIFDLYRNDDCCRTVKVGQDGAFSVDGLTEGQYVLSVLSAEGPLYSGLLKLSNSRSELEIDVATGTMRSDSVRSQPPR